MSSSARDRKYRSYAKLWVFTVLREICYKLSRPFTLELNHCCQGSRTNCHRLTRGKGCEQRGLYLEDPGRVQANRAEDGIGILIRGLRIKNAQYPNGPMLVQGVLATLGGSDR